MPRVTESKPSSLLSGRSKFLSPRIFVPVVLAFVVGTVFLVTRASGTFFAFEAEAGQITGLSSILSDNAASGGHYVHLGPSSGTPPPTSPPPTPPSGSPCGSGGQAPANYSHVIWFLFENDSYSSYLTDARLAYPHQLAAECGLATNFYSERDPSMPNYIAEVSGDIQGQSTDANPSNPGSFTANNIFNQVKQMGKQWRSYSESMSSNCYHQDYPPAPNASYTVHHEAAPYFADIAADCQNWDVPQGTVNSGAMINDIKNNTLPAFAVVGPNDDGGNSAAGGDVDPQKLGGYLQGWIPAITNSAAYKSGNTAIFITWDEDNTFGGAGEPVCTSTSTTCHNHIATIVIAPTVPSGTTSNTFFTHYSMLRSTEEMLGISQLLGQAATSNDMRSAFHM